MTRSPASRLSRRTALKGATALGLAAPGLAHLTANASPSPATHAHRVTAQATTLQLFHDKDPWKDYFAELSELATQSIDIAIEQTPYTDTTSYQQVINSSLDSGDVPDLCTWWSGYRLEGLYETGKLQDLSALWTAAIEAGDVPETLKSGFTFEDKQFGFPQNAAYWVTFYNKKVFDENGISVPTTWDEFLAVCESLKGAGVIPLYATIDGRWPAFIYFEEFLIRNDPDFYVELCEGRAKYTDPTAVKALEDWKALIDAEYFTELDIPMDANFAGMFANGEVGMVQIGTWYQQQFIAQELVPGEDFDAFILPNINPDLTRNVMVIETGAVVIPSDGKNLEASQEFAAWWMQEEAQTKWSTLLGDAPFNSKVTAENAVINGLVKTVGEKKYELYQRYWEASPPAIVENAVDELARFMLNPGEAQSVLEAIQKIADEEWQKRGGA
jgi:multiple sugar transport system substrate-binding protein